jgi:hypothetical protein
MWNDKHFLDQHFLDSYAFGLQVYELHVPSFGIILCQPFFVGYIGGDYFCQLLLFSKHQSMQ